MEILYLKDNKDKKIKVMKDMKESENKKQNFKAIIGIVLGAIIIAGIIILFWDVL